MHAEHAQTDAADTHDLHVACKMLTQCAHATAMPQSAVDFQSGTHILTSILLR